MCARPPQACRFGLQNHFSRFFMRYFSICSRCFLEWDIIQKLVGRRETANLMHFSFCFNTHQNTISSLHPFFVHIGQYLGCHLLPQAWGLHASLPQASIESETAFHTFKHGLSRQSQHLTQEGRNDPSVCIVTAHDLCHVLRPCLIKGRLHIQARQVQCWSYHRPHKVVSLRPCFLVDPRTNACRCARLIAHRLVSSRHPLFLHIRQDLGSPFSATDEGLLPFHVSSTC